MVKHGVIFATGFLLLAAVAVAGLEYLGKTQVDPVVRAYQDVQARHLAMFQDDQAYLRKFEIFRSVRDGKADAGPALNPRLPWSPPPAEPQTLAVKVSDTLTEQVLRFRSEWMRYHKRIFKNEKIDFSLFRGLAAFDHWDLERNSAVAELIDDGRFKTPEQFPIPGTINLLTLAKLRLAWGAEANEPLAALEQVRALARLLLTTENIQLFASGLAMLDSERLAYRYFVERGLMEEADWEPFPRNVTRRAARAVWATRGYFHVWTKPEILEKVFLGREPPIGLCEAVNEAAPKELSLRRVLGSNWPLERDFRSSYATLDEVIARAIDRCRLRYLTKMIELNRFESDFPLPGFFTSLPYSRKVFGLRIATLPFTGFESYDSPDPR